MKIKPKYLVGWLTLLLATMCLIYLSLPASHINLLSGHSLKTGLFKLAYLHTDDVIIQSGQEETGLKKIECAAKCIKKAYNVRASNLMMYL